MKVRPLYDRVLIKRIESEEKTPGGLYIPDSAKEKPVQGKVVAIGNGKLLENGQRVAIEVKVGDTVLFGKYSGNEVKIDGEEHVVLKEEEIYAIIEK